MVRCVILCAVELLEVNLFQEKLFLVLRYCTGAALCALSRYSTSEVSDIAADTKVLINSKIFTLKAYTRPISTAQ